MQNELFSTPKQAPAVQPKGPVISIHFDGGTPCNNPAKGYGIGYGSYRIDNDPVVRVNHRIRCSNNVAEILTLCCAVEQARIPYAWSPRENQPALFIEGDSKIALKWADVVTQNWENPTKAAKQERKASTQFQAAVARLRSALAQFPNVATNWLPREHALAAFGH